MQYLAIHGSSRQITIGERIESTTTIKIIMESISLSSCHLLILTLTYFRFCLVIAHTMPRKGQVPSVSSSCAARPNQNGVLLSTVCVFFWYCKLSSFLRKRPHSFLISCGTVQSTISYFIGAKKNFKGSNIYEMCSHSFTSTLHLLNTR